jgi:hypothetical protein
MPVDADLRGFAAVEVSLEPADGDPARSGRAVMRASL